MQGGGGATRREPWAVTHKTVTAARIALLAVDLDGTLVDSAPDLAYSLDRALEAIGLEPPGEARTRQWVGDGLEMLLARAIAHAANGDHHDQQSVPHIASSDQHAKALAAFIACYRANLYVRSRLYPGALATLDALEESGIRLCCITNKRLAFANELLHTAGVADRFELVLGGDSLPEKKPSPMQLLAASRELGVAPALAALVGDSHQDLRAAVSAQYSFIWSTYGYGRIDPAEAAPFPKIERFTQLCTLLAR